MILTPSEWARQKGFSRQYAAKLIKQGTIPSELLSQSCCPSEGMHAFFASTIKAKSLKRPLKAFQFPLI
jgi:hypothetical protein